MTIAARREVDNLRKQSKIRMLITTSRSRIATRLTIFLASIQSSKRPRQAKRLFCELSVLVTLLSATALAHAWGAEGHRLVAQLAYDELPYATRDRVRALLALEPGATPASISTWADEVRSPSTAA
jgi:hypothetical protein